MVPEYFDSSIIKINKNGDQVISTTLDDGEKLITGESYKAVKDGVLLTKSHDVALTPIQDPNDPTTTMTLDETKTSTFSGTTEGYSNSGAETSHDERDEHTDSGVTATPDDEENDVEDRQENPTNSGAPATEDAPSADGEANSNEAPADADVPADGEIEKPGANESKEKWFAYAKAVSEARGETFPYEDDYEGVTKKTLTEQYGA